jgi:hypothetical protein
VKMMMFVFFAKFESPVMDIIVSSRGLINSLLMEKIDEYFVCTIHQLIKFLQL